MRLKCWFHLNGYYNIAYRVSQIADEIFFWRLRYIDVMNVQKIDSNLIKNQSGIKTRLNPEKPVRFTFIPERDDSTPPGNYRVEVLGEWLNAYRDRQIQTDSTLFCSSAISDFYINNEHLQVPPTLEKALETFRNPIGQNSVTFWWGNKNDIDDGFDWNEEYITAAIALGIIGSVVFIGEKRLTPQQGRILFLNNNGHLDYIWQKDASNRLIGTLYFSDEEAQQTLSGLNLGRNEAIINIPYVSLSIDAVLQREIPLSSIFHVETTFPTDSFADLLQRIQPGIVSILRRLNSLYYY
jgi:hypothetical protein